MKKVVALLAAMIASLTLVAGTASASGDPITVRGLPCILLDGNGHLQLTFNSTLTLYQNQQTSKLVFRCEKNGAGAPSLTFYNYANTGLPCFVPFGGLTTDWSNKVGYNGNSQLTCTYTFFGPAPDMAADASGTTGGLG